MWRLRIGMSNPPKKKTPAKHFPNFMFLQKEGVSLSQSSPMEYTSDAICFAGSGNRRDNGPRQAFQSYASTLRTQAFIRQGLHTPDKIHWKSRRIQEGVACILGTSMSPTALWATFYAMSLRWPSLAHLSINSLMQWRWRKGSIQCFALGGSPCNSKKNGSTGKSIWEYL